MLNLKNATALVTGASMGLGAAFARDLASRGTNVVMVARSIRSLQELAKTLSDAHGVRCVALEADLADPGSILRIVEVLDGMGVFVDLLINNAGLGLTGRFLNHDLDKELGTIQVNVNALVGLTHAFGQRMAQRGRGGIINLASNAAFLPLPHLATYAAAKAFVLHFTEAIRYEMRASGVQVMAVVPGPTATSFFKGVSTSMKSTDLDDVRDVVRATLAAFLGGHSVAYPGRLAVRLGTLVPRIFSRDGVVRAAASKTKKMGLAS